jgi:DNA-binding NarL/FixJ family response regulator
MGALRILVADDHEVVRRGVRALLEAQPQWTVCGEATDGREAVEKTKELTPDVVVLDIAMPKLNGLDATRLIRKEAPRVEVLILTMHHSEKFVGELLAAGARGYVLKSDAGRDLVDAVKAVSQRKPFLSSRILETAVDAFLVPSLTKGRERPPGSQELTGREREVVQLLADGNSNKEVASALGISTKTAETHRAHIMRKLRLRGLSDLVRYAIRNGLVEP